MLEKGEEGIGWTEGKETAINFLPLFKSKVLTSKIEEVKLHQFKSGKGGLKECVKVTEKKQWEGFDQ